MPERRPMDAPMTRPTESDIGWGSKSVAFRVFSHSSIAAAMRLQPRIMKKVFWLSFIRAPRNARGTLATSNGIALRHGTCPLLAKMMVPPVTTMMLQASAVSFISENGNWYSVIMAR